MRAHPLSSTRSLLLILLAAVLAVLALGALLASGRDAGTLISVFSTRFLGIIIEALPFLLLGALTSGLIDAFLFPEDIARLTPRNPVLATLFGTFMGILFPVCECGIIPVVRRLYSKGLPLSVGVSFLLAAPVINPIVLASTFAAFGFGPVLIGRVVITAVVALITGLLFSLAARPKDALRPEVLALLPVAGGSAEAQPGDIIPLTPVLHRPGFGEGMRHALTSATGDFFDMGRYLVIGSLLAAAMQTFVPQEALLALGSGPVLSVLVMQLLAFVLSVCSTVDAFLALSFVGVFTPGSIMAFLTFGPMVDIKSTLMFTGVFRPKTVVLLIVIPFMLTFWAGVWINLNVGF
ncbi:MAG TPA: permease [Candidatus Limnocylindrales bacterium]|nr:permease [Candidatus Limnocylindrales bacterium]